jgi:hypothetical protein
MMIEPPGNLGRSRILEIDNGIFVARELVLIEQGAGAVHQAVILVRGPRLNTFAMKACK